VGGLVGVKRPVVAVADAKKGMVLLTKQIFLKRSLAWMLHMPFLLTKCNQV
jgi:hypothetical protein